MTTNPAELVKLADGRDWMDFPTKCGEGLTIDTKSAIRALEEVAISSEGLHPFANINWKQNASMLRNIAELIERMHAALATQQDAWQPIETAPKDGNLVLICGNGRSGYFVADARWDGGDWMLFDPNSDDWTEPCFEASHWRPLPAPPHT